MVFSFLISVLYSKAKVAAACAGIIYFLSYVPYMYLAIKEDIANDKIPAVYKTAAVSPACYSQKLCKGYGCLLSMLKLYLEICLLSAHYVTLNYN